MSLPANTPTFEDFVNHLFDHDPTVWMWHFQADSPSWECAEELTIDFISRLFTDQTKILERFSDAQLNQGFWYLLTDISWGLHSDAVPEQKQIECLRSFVPLFSNVFNLRCTPHLDHLDGAVSGHLNTVCYMWWDVLPIHGEPQMQTCRLRDATALAVMEEITKLESICCQESALHGLGHWHAAYPKEVEAIIARYISRNQQAPAELLSYAKAAMKGDVQ